MRNLILSDAVPTVLTIAGLVFACMGHMDSAIYLTTMAVFLKLFMQGDK